MYFKFTVLNFPCNKIRYVTFYTNLQHNFIGLLKLRHVSALNVAELGDNKNVVH